MGRGARGGARRGECTGKKAGEATGGGRGAEAGANWRKPYKIAHSQRNRQLRHSCVTVASQLRHSCVMVFVVYFAFLTFRNILNF